MTTTGNVNIDVEDGSSSVSVPATKIQVKIGCASQGPVAQVVATRSPKVLSDTFGRGPLPEAAALPTLKTGIVLAMRCAANAPGTASAVLFSGTGTSTMTLELDEEIGAFDDYLCQVEVLRGGTLGDPGIKFRASLDAGRTFGPPLTMPTEGVVSKGSVTSDAGIFPIAFVDGDTFLGKVDSDSADTATVNGTAATKTGSGATYAAVTAAHSIVVEVDGVAGQQAIVFAGTEDSQALFHAKINQQLVGAYVANAGGETKFFTNVLGTSAGGTIVSADADVLASLGLTTGAFAHSGTNNVANVAAVTAAELATLFEAAFTGGDDGAFATVNADGSLTVGSNTPGEEPNGFQFSSGSGVAKVAGFDTTEHNGEPTHHEYAIPQTGITLEFAEGTLVAGDRFRFHTVAPQPSDASITACLEALLASPYASAGWGSMHILGVTSAGRVATIQEGNPGLSQFADGYSFTRTYTDARDAAIPTAWGGAGETESTWMNSLNLAFSATSAKRVGVGAGHYNVSSAFTNPAAGAPKYRRPLAWAVAARQVELDPQTHTGQVSLGGLPFVIVDPISDPADGFIYHDERVNPGFDAEQGGAGRFVCARTRIKEPGLFVSNALLMSPPGSDFEFMELGLVMDVACSIVFQIGQVRINSNTRVNKPPLGAVGTIFEVDARDLEAAFLAALGDEMTSRGMISGADVVVDRTNNILTTKRVNVRVTITARGYIREMNLSIGYQNQSAAAA